MATYDKARQERYWHIWGEAGAVEGMNESQARIDEDMRAKYGKHGVPYTPADAQQDRKNKVWYRSKLATGNLSDEEIEELVRYEFSHRASLSLKDQVKRYYLQLKARNPGKAEQMLHETQKHTRTEITGVEKLEKLCNVLAKYGSLSMLHFRGEQYMIHNFEGFGPISAFYP